MNANRPTNPGEGILPHQRATTESATRTSAAGMVGLRARQNLAARRGVFGRRRYDADQVDQLLDALEQHLAAVMGEASRLRADNKRLGEIEHSRRHGLLPTASPTEAVDQDTVRLVMQAQQTADQILADAGTQAAALVADARRQYLNADTPPTGASGTAQRWQARAVHAEAVNAQLAQFLHRWAEWSTATAGQHVDTAQQHAAVLREAGATVRRLLADTAIAPAGGE